ncbi:MAG: CDP-alcohol phosphatidyltransferase family protein [Pontiella sp.]|nr:CDP-alcohol phosphatidyltransferase family protein [Pontiella sp.]
MKDQNFESMESGARFNGVPSMFTLCNALCGFSAIVITMGGAADASVVSRMALWLVCGAMFFDLLDGLAARLLNAHSMHGLQLDSLADAISFGAAPAVMIFRIIQHHAGVFALAEYVAWLMAGLYLGCAIWRLAAHNTRAITAVDDVSEKAVFVGLPSPAAAAMVCCMVRFLPDYLVEGWSLYLGYIAYAALSALLMVSSAPYPHLRTLFERAPTWIPVLTIVLLAGSLFSMGVVALLLWAHIYILSAPAVALAMKLEHRFDLVEWVRLHVRQ